MNIRSANMTKLLVTGGAGFIGSNFLKCVKDTTDFEVVGVIDKITYAAKEDRVASLGMPLIKLDICNPHWDLILYAYKPDIIVNFAAESHVDRSIVSMDSFIKSNYLGVYEIVKGVIDYNETRGKDIKILHVSTDEVLGDLPLHSYKELDEDAQLCPNNPYSASKAAADLMIQAMYRTHGNFSYAIVRPTNNYGLNQHPEKFIPTVIRHAAKNEKIPIYGDGKNIREWLHTLDLAEGLISLIHFMKNSVKFGEVFNFGSGVRLSNIEVAETILNLMEKPESLLTSVYDRPGHDMRYSLSSNKAKEVLGWTAKRQMIDFLPEIIQEHS